MYIASWENSCYPSVESNYYEGSTKTMEEIHSWQDILRKVTADVQERQRIANELGISTITLTRWVTGISTPKFMYLRKLAQIVPQELRSQFLESITTDFPSGIMPDIDDLEFQPTISAKFYSKVLNTYNSTFLTLRSTTISTLVLQEALKLLDLKQFGILLKILKCMPLGEASKVRSLRPFMSQGSLPWIIENSELDFFRGVESVEGLVTSRGHSLVLQTEAEGRRLAPASWLEFVGSMAVIPILRGEYIVGVFCLYSTQSYYFTTQKLELIQEFVNILALAFADDEFVYFKDISLDIMPPPAIQLPVLATFRTRVARYLLEDKEFVGLWQAEKKVWEEIETLLLENAESV